MFFSGALLFACTCEFNITSRIQERTDREILFNADSIASCSFDHLTTAEKEAGEMSEYLAWKKFLFSLISELYDQHLTLSKFMFCTTALGYGSLGSLSLMVDGDIQYKRITDGEVHLKDHFERDFGPLIE